MRRTRIATQAPLGLLLLQSCSANPIFHVFNNTQASILFLVGREEYTASPMAGVSFALTIPFEASLTDCNLIYTTTHPPEEYIGSGFTRAHIYAQVEPGGKLYLMLPEEKTAIDAATYPQPDGYPITPTMSGDCDWQADGDPSSGAEDASQGPGR